MAETGSPAESPIESGRVHASSHGAWFSKPTINSTIPTRATGPHARQRVLTAGNLIGDCYREALTGRRCANASGFNSGES